MINPEAVHVARVIVVPALTELLSPYFGPLDAHRVSRYLREAADKVDAMAGDLDAHADPLSP